MKIDEAMFNLSGSYSRRQVFYIRKGHGDLSKLKLLKVIRLHKVSWPLL